MGRKLLSLDEFPSDEAALLRADVEEAERGYTVERLAGALKRGHEASSMVGDSQASSMVRSRSDS